MSYQPPFNGGRLNATISGNTAGAGSLVSSGTLTLAGGNNITLSQAGNAITISGGAQSNQTANLYVSSNSTQLSSTAGIDLRSITFMGAGAASVGVSQGKVLVSVPTQTAQTQNRFNMTLTGNTAGAMAQVSSGTLSLAGGNNVTLSQAGNAVTISAAAQTVQTQNMVSVMGSTGNISFDNANNVSFGTNGSTITASASFNQTNQTVGLYGLGNTTQNSSTTLDARSISFNGLGGVSVGYSNGSVQISGATGGAAANNTIGMSNLGNTSGTTGVISGSALQYAFAGGNNVTLSQSINGSSATITVSAAAQTNQTGNFYVSSNSTQLSSTAGIDLRSITFMGAGAASVGVSQGKVLVSSPVQTVQTQNMVSVLGSTGNISFDNANNVSFGTNGSTITASASFNQTNQNISLYALGNTTQNSSTVRNASNLSFNGLGNISIGYSNGSIQISGAGGGGGVALYDGANSISSGTARFSASGALTASINGQTLNLSVPAQSNLSATGILSISNNGNTISIGAPAFSIGMSTNGNTSGTSGTVSNQLIFAGGNNIYLSQSTGAGGNTITISAVSQSNQTGNFYVSSNSTQLSSTAGIDLRSITFMGAGAASVGVSQGKVLVSVPTQTNQNISLYGLGNTTQNSSTVLNASNLSFNGLGGITVGYSNGSIQLSGAAGGGGGGIALANSQTTYTSGTAQLLEGGGAITIASTTGQKYNFSVPAVSSISATGAFSISSNGSTVSMGVPAVSMGMSNIGNTSGTSGTVSNQLIFAGGNNIYLSQSTGAGGNTITISASAQTNQTLGMYAVSTNTVSSSSGTFDARSLSFRGVGAANVGYSNGSVIISAPNAAAGNVTFSAGGNSAGLASIVFSNSNGVSFGLNGSTITASAAGGGGGGIALANSQTTYTSGTARMVVAGGAMTIASTTGQSFNFSVPATSSLSATGQLSIVTNGATISMGVPGPVTYSYFNPQDAYPLAAGQHGQATLHIQPAQAPNVQFDRVVLPIIHSNATNSSGSQTVSFWVGIYTRSDSSLSLAASTSASFALTQSGTAGNYSLYGGQRLVTIGSTSALTEGQYYIGIISRTTSAGTNASFSQLVASQINSNYSGVFGEASNASVQQTRGLGYYSASTTALPSAIPFTDIRGTASMALRQPSIYFVSQTF